MSNVTIKWPNDIYINNKKVAGLLIHQSIQGKQLLSAVVGIGLNVNQETFPDYLPNPISIQQCTEKSYDLDMVVLKMLEAFSHYYALLRNRKFILLKKEYLSYLYRRGEVCLFEKEDSSIQGEILGIDSDGKLQLSIDNKIQSFSMHEIKMKI